jgi:hypothetical protein
MREWIMFVHTKTIPIAAIASIAALSSSASAQFGNGAIAMQWINSISQPQQSQSLFVQFENFDFQGQSQSFVVLLNQNQDRSGFGFQDLPIGTNDFSSRLHNPQGIDASSFVRPKDEGLNIVPLPPAAFAGVGLLAGIVGVRALRRHGK